MKDALSSTILVVDDTEAGRYTMVRTLQRAGFTVWEAATGEDALRLAANKPDLVVLDVNLPDLHGYEVCRRIKANPTTASTMVLHVSASQVESESRSLGLEEGADGYLIHPVEPRELLANIEALLRLRRAERFVGEQRELLQVTLSSIGDAVITTDMQGLVTFMNPVAQALTGWQQEESAGKPVQEVFHIVNEETRLAVENPVEKALREGAIVGMANHTILLTRDGVERPIDDSAAPIRDMDGKVVGVVMVFRDVTERRQAENQISNLLAAERRHSQQLSRVAAAAVTINAAGNLESALRVCTEEARQIIGAHQALASLTRDGEWTDAIQSQAVADSLAGAPPPMLKPNSDGLAGAVWRNNQPMRIGRAAAQAHPAWRELSLGSGRGSPRNGWLAAPLVSRKDKVLGLLQLADKEQGDFTEEDENLLVMLAQVASVAIENAGLIDALRETDRLKDEFLAMLAHELRNPLAPILNAVQVLRMKVTDNADARWATEVTNRQVLQLSRLVDDLLDVARINQGKINLQKEVVDLSEVVSRAIETSRPVIQNRHHHFELSMPAEPLYVEADPVRLAQVLWNLLSNAAKYTPEGGRISLTVTKEGDTVVARVRDTGMGIAPDMLPRIFDLFAQVERTLDRAEGGLGIGLTLVRRLTQMHGGTVAATSAGPGKGSEFTIRLPLRVQAPKEVVSEPHRASSRVAPSSRRILVVDDNKDSANSLTLLLRLLGHEVCTAYDGPEALDTVARIHPDVVLMDIGLPGMSGYDVARKMRASPSNAQTLLVALTGYGAEDDRLRSLEAGFRAHLIKPVDIDSLRAILQETTAKLSRDGSAS